MIKSHRKKRILKLIETIWDRSPHLRFGQSIWSKFDFLFKDMFYVEDDELEKKLVENMKGGRYGKV